MRRAFVLLVGLAACVAAPGRAEDRLVQPPGAEPQIATGVMVAGLAVAGMNEERARLAVRARFDRPLVFTFRTRRWRATPERLYAHAAVRAAVDAALLAVPGARVPLRVTVSRYHLRRYVAYLGRRFHRAPRSSRLLLRSLRPYITRARSGRRVRIRLLRHAIRRALLTHDRGPLRLRVRPIAPRITRSDFGSIVVIRRGSKRLKLYRGMRLVRSFGVATGQSRYPTPLGRFSIVVKARNPWWYPPSSPWADGLDPVPPGPGNPLGTRWLGLSASGIGIHGTPDAASIGYSASHGCIRMRIPSAEWLFERVSVGTPVFIVKA